MIRPVRPVDAQALANPFNPCIRDTTITFEEEPVTAEEMAARIEKLGFRKAGHMREAGRKFDRWIDVGSWELLL